MAKSNKLIVQDLEIALTKVNDEDYICVTDMIKAKEGDFLVFFSFWISFFIVFNFKAFFLYLLFLI